MSIESDVMTCRAAISTMRSWKGDVSGWVSDYHSVHNETYCKNLTDLHTSATTAKGDIETIIRQVEKLLDDTEWVSTLRLHGSKWESAARAVGDAEGGVAGGKLRADSSWKGGSGEAYRTAASQQRAALGRVGPVVERMASGCSTGAQAGETFFSSLATALETCADGLPKGPFPGWDGTWSPNPDYNPGGDTGYDHTKEFKDRDSCDNHIDDCGSDKTSSCTTAVTEAETTLKDSFTNAFLTYGNYSHGGPPTQSLADAMGSWPKAPGAH